MTIGKLTAIVALATGIAAAAPALASWDDETGFTSLGVDITTAGSSPAAVQQFIAGLAPETQRGLLNGCQTAVTYPSTYAPSVVAFCDTAIGGGIMAMPATPVMGFVQEEPMTFGAPMPDAIVSGESNPYSGNPPPTAY